MRQLIFIAILAIAGFEAAHAQLLLTPQEINEGLDRDRINSWIPVPPTISIIDDPNSDDRFAVTFESDIVAFAVVRDEYHKRDRRIDLWRDGKITIRNYCFDYGDRLTTRNQRFIQFYVYEIF